MLGNLVTQEKWSLLEKRETHKMAVSGSSNFECEETTVQYIVKEGGPRSSQLCYKA